MLKTDAMGMENEACYRRQDDRLSKLVVPIVAHEPSTTIVLWCSIVRLYSRISMPALEQPAVQADAVVARQPVVVVEARRP